MFAGSFIMKPLYHRNRSKSPAVWVTALALLAWPVAPAAAAAGEYETQVRPILTKQCFGCHGEKVQTAGLNLAAFTEGNAAAQKPELWRAVREKINGHLMPPPPLPGLSAAEAAAVTGWIDSVAVAPAPAISAGPGRVTARRLNRLEFNNTLRDFLGITARPGDDFPVDNQGYGFDNIGDVLSLSPMLMEKFMSAARSASRIAVYGEPYDKKPSIVGKLLVKSVQDDGHVSGNQIGFSMRGTLDGIYHAPVEADYVLQFRIANRRGFEPGVDLSPNGAGAAQGGGRGGRGGGRGPRAPLTEAEKKARLEAAKTAAPPAEFNVDVDGRQVRKDTILGDESFDYDRGPTVAKVHLTAGDHRIQAYFPDNANLADPRTNLARDGRRKLAADFVEIVGPFEPSSAPPASYSRIFICGTQDAACVRRIVENLELRGYRRPPTEAETQRLLKLIAFVRRQGDSFEEGIRVALQSVLVSPSFLFRIERDPSAGPSSYRVNDFEMASRLSYFLWSSMPDEELLKLAGQHRLSQKPLLEAQVKRMLADPKAGNLVDDFAVQWLDLRALDRKKPDAVRFPLVDDELLGYMRRETLLFVGEIFHDDRSLLELIDGKFTWLNGPLARYYGIAGVNGFAFERVAFDANSPRGGILTQGSILSLTSYATRTSPVIRGKWVLESLLGAAPPPPPPDVPALEEKNLGTEASVRVRLEQHRANPACAVCHRQMDPIGFGLENFDAAGGWRSKEGKFDVDASGVLPDGRAFEGPNGLRGILRSQSASFTRNLTEKMLTFALGRGVETSDRVAVDRINQTVIASGNKLSALVTGIVESEPFQMRKKEEVLHASR